MESVQKTYEPSFSNKLKIATEDSLEDEHGPLNKRPKYNTTGRSSTEIPSLSSEHNPVDELSSLLGLRLRKSPSLLDLIQVAICRSNIDSSTPPASKHPRKRNLTNKNLEGRLAAAEKFKASNFAASTLRIGNWEYVSTNKGDLVAKLYFSKQKLVWEILKDGLKSKIEIQWSNTIGLKASCSENRPDCLTVVLARQPGFFKEINPQPRKQTLWRPTSDFTHGQASVHRHHFLQCPAGVLNKHYEMLLQSDLLLKSLSQQPENVRDSMYSENPSPDFSKPEIIQGRADRPERMGTLIPTSLDISSPAATPSASWSYEHEPNTVSSEYLEEAVLYPNSSDVQYSNKTSEHEEMLDKIAQNLLNDNMQSSGLAADEKSLMKKVDSLCCLLQLDDPLAAEAAEIHHGQTSSSDMDEKSVMKKVNSLCCLLQLDSPTLSMVNPKIKFPN